MTKNEERTAEAGLTDRPWLLVPDSEELMLPDVLAKKQLRPIGLVMPSVFQGNLSAHLAAM